MRTYLESSEICAHFRGVPQTNEATAGNQRLGQIGAIGVPPRKHKSRLGGAGMSPSIVSIWCFDRGVMNEGPEIDGDHCENTRECEINGRLPNHSTHDLPSATDARIRSADKSSSINLPGKHFKSPVESTAEGIYS
uniref:Uncharacterized protein n=1 Tax=Steinernema glaseri TaxID=37863 RepID=A0A1I7YH03_9BILA